MEGVNVEAMVLVDFGVEVNFGNGESDGNNPVAKGDPELSPLQANANPRRIMEKIGRMDFDLRIIPRFREPLFYLLP